MYYLVNMARYNWLWWFGDTPFQSTSDYTHKMPVILCFDVLFVVSLIKLLTQQWMLAIRKTITVLWRHALFMLYSYTSHAISYIFPSKFTKSCDWLWWFGKTPFKSPVDSPIIGQLCWNFMFYLLASTSCWNNNRRDGDLRHNDAQVTSL